MFPRILARALGAWVLCVPLAAVAASDADLAGIRAEIRDLKDKYEARIRALEERLTDAEAKAAMAAAAATPPAGTGAAASTPPGGGYAAGTLAAFNPGISVVLQGTYANLSQNPAQFAINGIQTSEDVGTGRRGLGLGESEISFFGNVDDKVAGSLTVSLSPRNEVSVEEAYGALTALPYGLVPKFGRFFSGIGYLNEQHQHVWDFQDAPLAYQAFLGNQFAQDGAQLKWVAPTDTFLEFGAEIGNGDAFPGSPRNSNGVGAGSVFVHAGGDVGDNASWRAGLSYLETRASDRQGTLPDTSDNLANVAFAGRSRTAVADFIWKYAPTGNAKRSNVKVQGEYFWRREHGELTYDANGALGVTQTGAYSSSQSGWYLQGVWQFVPAWRVGARYDRLAPGTPDYGVNDAYLSTGAFTPQKTTVMLDYTPSEFSRFRVQYAESRTRTGLTDHQLFLQYILSLGAHPAHKF
ncbi:MAG: TonB-dependent receptor [Betaproteobacteria bacterium]